MRLVTLFTLVTASVAHAQFFGGPADFSTTGSDAQRSSWVRADPKISADALRKPGFQFLWKVKLANDAKQSTVLSPAALLTRYIGYRGFRSLGFIGSSADKIFALDTDLGRIEWQKPIATATSTCGMTANLARPVSAGFPGAGGGRGFGGGRGGAAKSAVGEPNEGSVTLKEMAARGVASNPFGPAPAGRGGSNAGRGAAGGPGAPGGGGGRMRMPSYLHAISSDGMFHSMYISNGDEPEPPIKFLPPNATAVGLTIIDNVAYAVTTSSCGGAANAVWALDLASKEVASWRSPAGAIAGSAGAAFGPDGTLYVATDAGDLVALEAKTLKVRDIYKAGMALTSSPVVLQRKDGAMIAVAAKDGRIHLLDTAKLGGPAYQSEPVAAGAGALATWQDSAGTRFLLAPAASSLVALKVADQALETAWKHEIDSPLAPLVINGVVFAASRGKAGTPAVLYALDGSGGSPLWDSGKTIASFVRGGGISGGGSQVYLGTNDGTFYAFGYPIEH
jgi:outer membrane protein assembly factor BamB